MTALPGACRNAPATTQTWWSGSTWTVTSDGLEAADGHSISADSLAEFDAGGLRWVTAMS